MLVTGTWFTFYKTSAKEDYIKETSCRFATEHSLVIQRHPVNDAELPEYNFRDLNERSLILECISSIKQWLLEI